MKRLLSLLVNGVLIVLSLAFCFLVGEGTIRTLQYFGKLPVYDRQTLNKVDPETHHWNAKVIRSKNPELYFKHKKGDPNLNKAGFRDEEFKREKAPGVYRIALLGDSVGYGYSVHPEKIFEYLLEQKLDAALPQKIEIYNFSVSGYGTTSELELYKTQVLKYNPDMVILAYVLNDPIPTSFGAEILAEVWRKMHFFNRMSDVTQFGAWLFLRWGEAQQPFNSLLMTKGLYEHPEFWGKTEAAFTELKSMTDQRQQKLVTVIFPMLIDFDRYKMQKFHTKVGDSMTKLGVPFHDVLQDYRGQDYRQLRRHPHDDPHPSELGHQLAADGIFRFLMNQQLVTPQQQAN